MPWNDATIMCQTMNQLTMIAILNYSKIYQDQLVIFVFLEYIRDIPPTVNESNFFTRQSTIVALKQVYLFTSISG